MKKVIGIILIIVISLVILTGCTSEAETRSRFIYIGDGIGSSEIYYDKETKVQYMYHVGYKYGAFLIVLVDVDGKPLLYQGD